MSAPLLHLSGVGKDYAKLDTTAGRIALVFALLRGRGPTHVFRALDDVSFELAAGENQRPFFVANGLIGVGY